MEEQPGKALEFPTDIPQSVKSIAERVAMIESLLKRLSSSNNNNATSETVVSWCLVWSFAISVIFSSNERNKRQEGVALGFWICKVTYIIWDVIFILVDLPVQYSRLFFLFYVDYYTASN